MERYLIAYQYDDEEKPREIVIEAVDHQYAIRYAEDIANSEECSVQLKRLGVVDEWTIKRTW